MDLTAKITTFCRELGDPTLLKLARRQNKEALLQRARETLAAGDLGPALEADLDALDEMVKQETGQRLFMVTRGYSPLPGFAGDPGAQWWNCPVGRCAGRGRVRPGQQPPVCAAAREQLVPGPLSG
jgi:hypothetical protein